jgi:hypothetical protein
VVEDVLSVINISVVLLGSLGPDHAQYPNISVVQRESLYLPGFVGEFFDGVGGGCDYMPGSTFASGSLYTVYNEFDGDSGEDSKNKTDYSGANNFGLYAKWQTLSRTPLTAAKIINLVWTDIAASTVVGTKSSLGSRSQSSGPVQIYVRPIVTRIRYRWVFAIPSFIVLALCVCIAIIALVTFLFHRHNFAKLSMHIHQTSVGQIITTFVYPEGSRLDTPRKVWNKNVGKNVLDLGGANPLIDLLAMNNVHKWNTSEKQPGVEVDTLGLNEVEESGHEIEERGSNEENIAGRVPSPDQDPNEGQESSSLMNRPDRQ